MPTAALTSAEQAALDATIRAAEQACRAEISVFVGPIEGHDPHAFATSLHNTLVLPSRSILVMVDPTLRAIEVVTGGEVRRTLTDADPTLPAKSTARTVTVWAPSALKTRVANGVESLTSAGHAGQPGLTNRSRRPGSFVTRDNFVRGFRIARIP